MRPRPPCAFVFFVLLFRLLNFRIHQKQQYQPQTTTTTTTTTASCACSSSSSSPPTISRPSSSSHTPVLSSAAFSPPAHTHPSPPRRTLSSCLHRREGVPAVLSCFSICPFSPRFFRSTSTTARRASFSARLSRVRLNTSRRSSRRPPTHFLRRRETPPPAKKTFARLSPKTALSLSALFVTKKKSLCNALR